MNKIALTGGIGSGKSLVAKIFKTFGIPLYLADIEAKRLMNENPDLRKQIVKLLGREAYLPEGGLNKKFIAEKIFHNKELLEKINKLVHPAVADDFENWTKTQKAPYLIKEAALLYESGQDASADAVIVVSAPDDLRIERVCKRDATSKEAVKARMKNQMPQNEKDKRADYLIINDGEKALLPQVLKVHENILQKKNAG